VCIRFSPPVMILFHPRPPDLRRLRLCHLKIVLVRLTGSFDSLTNCTVFRCLKNNQEVRLLLIITLIESKSDRILSSSSRYLFNPQRPLTGQNRPTHWPDPIYEKITRETSCRTTSPVVQNARRKIQSHRSNEQRNTKQAPL
jgi:hypothetical protein